MRDVVESILDWLPLIVVGAYVVIFVRPKHIVEFLIGRALKKGKAERAMAIAIRYARLRPGDPQSWLTWVWLVENQEVRWGSEGILREGFERNPKSFELGLRLAKEMSRKDKAGEAYELLERLGEHHPEAPGPVIEMARLAGMANNETEAKRRIAEARDLIDPKKHASEAVDIAYLCLLLGDRGTAEEVLQRVEERAYEPAAHLFLAVLTEETNPVGARRHLAAARYYWHGPRSDAAEFLEEARELIRSR